MPTNYKLTTNLIADCMALIPHNLELLNEDYDFFASGDMDVEYFYNGLHPRLKFLELSHCLRTIQEFQRPNLEYVRLRNKANSMLEVYKHNISRKNQGKDFDLCVVAYYEEDRQRVIGLRMKTPKTIASATLHGQGEYPPSTLEELCESYKNVMNKQN